MGMTDYMQRAKRHKVQSPLTLIFAEGIKADTYRLSFQELLEWGHAIAKAQKMRCVTSWEGVKLY